MRRQAETPRGPTAGLVGQSPPMRRLRALIARVSPTDATVLILGERGTGKELVARALQQASRRRDRPFVVVNCAALPDELLASELFGHERGAFTGAVGRRPGLLVAADGGTVFLDEIGDLSSRGQAMLLRFLQEREVRPVGAARATRVDVRVLAATNRDLGAAIERGQFRADLHDRLAEIVLEVPPLRARGDDLTLLVRHFLALHARRHGTRARALTPVAWACVKAHTWPGNVRELSRALSRGVILSRRGWVDAGDLELTAALTDRAQADATGDEPAPLCPGWTRAFPAPPGVALTPRQRAALRLALAAGHVRRADLTGLLGISGETARRDLAVLVRLGWLTRTGRCRTTHYSPAGQLPHADPA